MAKKLLTLCTALMFISTLFAQNTNNTRYGDPDKAQLGIYNQTLNGAKMTFSASDIQFWCGSGSNSAIIVVGWDDSSDEVALAWGVRWSGSAVAIDLIDSIATYDSRFSYQFSGGMIGFVEYHDDALNLASSTNWWCYYVNGSWAGGYGSQSVSNGDFLEMSATCTWNLSSAIAATNPNSPAATGYTRVVVGNGTAAAAQPPFCSYYNNGTSLQLYPASEIGVSGVIDTLWFYKQAGSGLAYTSLNMYLGSTSQTEVGSWSLLSEVAPVYSSTNGSLDTLSGWQPFVLNTPYYYNGTENLLVAVCRQGANYSLNQQYAYTSATNSAFYTQDDNDATAGTLAGAATRTGTSSNQRPNIMLSIDTLGIIPCLRPDSISLSNLTPYATHLSWQSAPTVHQWMLTFSPSIGGSTELAVSSDTLTLNGLTPNTEYTITIRSICGSDDTSNAATFQFITPCVALTADDLPYLENFNSYSTGSSSQISQCWHRGTNSSTAYPYPYSSTNVDGTTCLYFYAYQPSSITGTQFYSYAALPQYAGVISNLMLSFDMRSYSSSTSYPERYVSRMIVGVMSNPSDTATFVPVDTITIANLNTTLHAEVYFDNYAGSGQYIALMDLPIDSLDMPVAGTKPTYSWIYVDNVALQNAPNCRAIQNLSAQAAGSDSIILSWDEVGTASAWIVTYAADGDAAATTLVANASPFTVTGLTPNTSYQFSVQALCSASDTADALTINCRTNCPATLALPYSEDFNSVQGAATSGYYMTVINGNYPQPSCWQFPSLHITGGSTSTNTPQAFVTTYSSYAMDATPYLSLHGYSTTKPCLAVLPVFDTPVAQLQLSFDYRQYSTANGMLQIGVMSDPADTTTFVLIESLPRINQATHYEHDFSLDTNLPANALHIAFRHVQMSNSYLYNSYLDNISVTLAPTCKVPRNVSVSINENTASLSWNAPSGDSFQVGYGTSGCSTDSLTLISGILADTCSLTIPNGLTDLYLRAVCGSSTSPWVGPFLVAAGLHVMDGNDTITSCNTILTDNGGLNGQYSNSRNDTVVFISPNGCSSFRIYGDIVTENNYDYLYLYSSETGAYDYRYCGNASIDYTSPSGFLKVIFHTDGSGVRDGFALNVVCVSSTAPIADSLTATVLNDSTVTLTWTGESPLWLVRYNGITDTVAANSHTITGLNPTAIHTLSVASLCGADLPEGWTSINVRLTYTVSALSADTSMGTVTGSGCYMLGATATLAALAAEHHHFVMWTDGITLNPRTLIVSGDTTLTASFAIDTFLISATSADETMGTVTGSGSYPYGQQVTLTATPLDGYHFLQWSDGDTNQMRLITVQADAQYQALFAEDLRIFTLTVLSADETMGTVTGSGQYAEGTEVTLTATALSGYRFAQWNDGVTESIRTITLVSDSTFTATFELLQGIDAILADGIRILTASGALAIEGAQGQQLTIYDLSGRIIFQDQCIDRRFYPLPHTGVYMVSIGRRPAIKVVIR